METGIIQILTLIFMMIYFIIQSKKDRREQQVWTFLNNIGVYWNIIAFIAIITLNKITLSFIDAGCITIIVISCLLSAYKYKTYGSGDAKAMIAILFSLLQFCSIESGIMMFFLSVIISQTTFISEGVLYAIKNRIPIKTIKKTYRAAYFPHIYFGFSCALYLLRFL